MKTNAHSKSYLSKEIADARRLVRHIQHGYDRMTLWIDSSDPDLLPITLINSLCEGGAKLFPRSLGFHPVWKLKLQMLQPTRKALTVVRDALGTEHNVLITKIEVTVDFITRSSSEASEIEAFLLEHLVVPHWRNEVRLEAEYGTIHHFAPRYAGPEGSDAGSDPEEDEDRDPANETRRVRGRNFGLYADKESKLPGPWAGRACAHFESRLSGSKAIKEAGIGSMSDLLAFDHPGYWARTIRLKRIESLLALGRWTDVDEPEVSDEMLRRRAHQYLNSFRLAGGQFVMQNALLANRTLSDVLVDVPVALFFAAKD